METHLSWFQYGKRSNSREGPFSVARVTIVLDCSNLIVSDYRSKVPP